MAHQPFPLFSWLDHNSLDSSQIVSAQTPIFVTLVFHLVLQNQFDHEQVDSAVRCGYILEHKKIEMGKEEKR